MNAVLTLTRNCLDLTRKCVASIFAQDIPVELFVFDNGSTDGTREWLLQQHGNSEKRCLHTIQANTNFGVSRGWNIGLQYFFGLKRDHAPHNQVLVVNNDVVLPPWFYRELLSYEQPFITGMGVDSMEAIAAPAERMPLVPAPDFSAFLVSRPVWDTVGPFNEDMKLYAQDCDYHIRAHRLGIGMGKANLPYFHQNSSTMRMATITDRADILEQANKDRNVFLGIYGCLPGTPAYGELLR
jgi:GT2 family glycosyltransferase